MRHAIVIANRTGRRTVRLDDGQAITFSLDVCAFTPHVDQSVWVEVDPTGTHATSLAITVRAPAVEAPRPSCFDRLMELRALGLGKRFDRARAEELVADLQIDPLDESALRTILDAHYSDLPDAARAEGWLSFDWRYPLGDCLRDVADLVGGRPLLILLDAQERLTTERGYRETRTRVKLVARDGTTVERDMEYVEEVLVIATETLAREGDERAFYHVDGERDDAVTVILATRAMAADIGRILPLVAVER